MIGNFIAGFVVMFIGKMLFPTIKAQLIENNLPNYLIIPISVFYWTSLSFSALGMVVMALRNIGLIGGKYKEEYEESLKEEPEKEHKQTYYEYVQEKLAVEKEMRRR